MEWKWTKGEPYERSRRRYNNHNQNNEQLTTEEELFAESNQMNKEHEISAYSSSLNYDENTWDILNQEVASNGFKLSNKREDLDLKIADRQLVQQRGFNPFLSENNYVDDVTVRDNYLKPQNTTNDYPKNE
jgi:hypothetical protein